MQINDYYHVISKWFRDFASWGKSEPLIPPHGDLTYPFLVVVFSPADTPFKTFLLWAEHIDDAKRRFETIKETHITWDDDWTVAYLHVDRSEVYDLDPNSITYLTPTQ